MANLHNGQTFISYDYLLINNFIIILDNFKISEKRKSIEEGILSANIVHFVCIIYCIGTSKITISGGYGY
jgi:hypothetical protein